uniref:MHD domain-containing protein n=1 Tax=Rhabditophanes sp. KR3021 TaxID=114890 RepID=A0AC35U0L0_9BILA
MIINSAGVPVNYAVKGFINLKIAMTAESNIKIALCDKFRKMLQNRFMHQCVNIGHFDITGEFMFVLPEGIVTLANYQLTPTCVFKPYIMVSCNIVKEGFCKCTFNLTLRTHFSCYSIAREIKINVPLPDNAINMKSKSEIGSIAHKKATNSFGF